MNLTSAHLRDYAAARTLFARTGLQDALNRLKFVQADPIRAPARAQDLILMQRVRGYRAGDLERRYPRLDAEEDIIPNYGFVTREVQRLLHPRAGRDLPIDRLAPGLTAQVLALAHTHGELHPRVLDTLLARGRVENAWGGQSSATTRALDALHYRGALRVARREGGVRIYAPAGHLQPHHESPLDDRERALGIVMLLAELYAPLPEASLRGLLSLSGYGAPGLKALMRPAMKRATEEGQLQRAVVDGAPYLWPSGERPQDAAPPEGVRLVAPFDPLVWDRRRFEHLHGWAYRFEAYTPAPRRVMGYYALPMFLDGRAVGWANLSLSRTPGARAELQADLHYRPGVRQGPSLIRAVRAELERYRTFLGAGTPRERPA